ncbi:hypothetical protein BAE44_0007363 [Dichanthelium oligosanthes]|uniref:Uncharacterized protein n=1 Tax=Dichanthelium oligosanthes TaxID=888268 RepID=A0A1E5W2L1_9POAL|nr:hypothetical protein BAE44_0007363 [Dichanthelium oligosanthes]
MDGRMKRLYSAASLEPPLSPPLEYVPPTPLPTDLVDYYDHFIGGDEDSGHEIQEDAPPPSYPSLVSEAPLLISDGNFVGMNFDDEEETPFLPRHIIVKCLKHLETRIMDDEQRCPIRWPVPKPYWSYPTFNTRLGYPNQNLDRSYYCGDYDLDYNLLLVNIKNPPLPVAHLNHQLQLGSCSKVLAVGRIFSSRKLMATSGLVNDTISIFDQKAISIPTCQTSKVQFLFVGIGGPLIDDDGNFHGMNFYGVEETPFLPSIILKCLRSFGMFRYVFSYLCTTASPLAYLCMLADLLSLLPTGMHLIHSFGEKFCKVDGSSGDFPNELSVELASNLSQNVVSLASFNGKTMWFACSGILIEYDLHTSVLTSASLIEVRLPNGQCVKGTLQYCNLEFNIAVVNSMVFPDFRAANLYYPMEVETASEVVAVGRIFSSGRLTATRGIVTDKKSNLDCDKLMVSTCKITKTGIGRTLVDFSGSWLLKTLSSAVQADGQCPNPIGFTQQLRSLRTHWLNCHCYLWAQDTDQVQS